MKCLNEVCIAVTINMIGFQHLHSYFRNDLMFTLLKRDVKFALNCYLLAELEAILSTKAIKRWTIMDLRVLEQQLYLHCKPLRDIILCKVVDRNCLIEESDVCLVMAIGEQTYTNKYGYVVEVNLKKGDRVLVPRKVRRITADITTNYFLVSMFDILSVWN